ncbi:MAG: ABC transporter ATP-binding protein [Gammaproteobacteria bacterium]|jgi:iron complex transport system ATP-binding protein
MGDALLQTRGLEVRIAGKHVCHQLDLDVARGECLGLLGGNGVGKSTLLHTLAGLRPAEAGEIRADGSPLESLARRERARRIGILMQREETNFPATVLETALIGRHPHIGFWRWESHADVAMARRILRQVGMDGLEQRPQDQLSGGERRRLAIATVLAQDPRIFLLDEPTNQLDLHHQLMVLDLFRARAREQGRGLVMALHDVNLAARYCQQVMLLFGQGETLIGPVDEVLNEDNLSRLFHTRVRGIRSNGDRVFVPESLG